MTVAFSTYERVAPEVDGQRELVCGRLRKKPGGTVEHIDVVMKTGFVLHAGSIRTSTWCGSTRVA